MSLEIIAEIAQGYEGNPTIARLLAKAAVQSGADAIKYQFVIADEVATPDYRYFELFKKLSMPLEIWKEVASIVKTGGKKLYFDVGGELSLKNALELGCNGVKIHATNFFNTELVRAALASVPKVFISLGGISIEEFEEFLNYHNVTPGQKVCLMYGYQAEPTPIEANNLLRIKAIKKRFPRFPLGFMDHTDGSSDEAQSLSLLALPLGIEYLEKHLSLDRELRLEDYISALPPTGFQRFVNRIRRYETALGTDSLDLTENEKTYRAKVLKVVVAQKHQKKGERIGHQSIALKRVSSVIETAIYRKEDALGKILVSDVLQHQQITKEMLS